MNLAVIDAHVPIADDLQPVPSYNHGRIFNNGDAKHTRMRHDATEPHVLNRRAPTGAHEVYGGHAANGM